MFAVADTAATTEIIWVTAATTSSPWVWGVTRGAENTTPVTHASNFTVQEVVTSGGLTNFSQVYSNGNTAVTSITSTGWQTLASFIPPVPDVPAAGVVYDFVLFGIFSNVSTGSGMTLATEWNQATIASANTASSGVLPSSMTTASFWMEGKVHCYGATTMVSGFNFQSLQPTHGTQCIFVGSSSAGVTTSGTAGPLAITARLGTNNAKFTVAGFFCHRIS
ncbi:MAG TPA: hypothetical protein VGR89_00735 [Puia sp.]|nr:hypothetical protein [Puia sp.]